MIILCQYWDMWEWSSAVNYGFFIAEFAPNYVFVCSLFFLNKIMLYFPEFNNLKLHDLPFNLTQVKTCFSHLKRCIINKK